MSSAEGVSQYSLAPASWERPAGSPPPTLTQESPMGGVHGVAIEMAPTTRDAPDWTLRTTRPGLSQKDDSASAALTQISVENLHTDDRIAIDGLLQLAKGHNLCKPNGSNSYSTRMVL